MKKEEEKNKVGRPKLADDSLKKKSYIMLVVSIVLVLSLIFGGLFSLTNINSFKLKGATSEKIKAKISVEKRYNSAIIKWASDNANISSFAIYKKGSSNPIIQKFPKTNRSNGSWKIENLSPGTTYTYSAIFRKGLQRDERHIDFTTYNKVKFDWNKLERYTYVKDGENMYFVFSKTSPGVELNWGFSGPGDSIIKGVGLKGIGEYTKNGNINKLEVAFNKAGTYTISAWQKGDKSNIATKKITVKSRVTNKRITTKKAAQSSVGSCAIKINAKGARNIKFSFNAGTYTLNGKKVNNEATSYTIYDVNNKTIDVSYKNYGFKNTILTDKKLDELRYYTLSVKFKNPCKFGGKGKAKQVHNIKFKTKQVSSFKVGNVTDRSAVFSYDVKEYGELLAYSVHMASQIEESNQLYVKKDKSNSKYKVSNLRNDCKYVLTAKFVKKTLQREFRTKKTILPNSVGIFTKVFDNQYIYAYTNPTVIHPRLSGINESICEIMYDISLKNGKMVKGDKSNTRCVPSNSGHNDWTDKDEFSKGKAFEIYPESYIVDYIYKIEGNGVVKAKSYVNTYVIKNGKIVK